MGIQFTISFNLKDKNGTQENPIFNIKKDDWSFTENKHTKSENN